MTKKGRSLVRRAITEIAEIEAAWLERFAAVGHTDDLHGVLEAALRATDGSRNADDTGQMPPS